MSSKRLVLSFEVAHLQIQSSCILATTCNIGFSKEHLLNSDIYQEESTNFKANFLKLNLKKNQHEKQTNKHVYENYYLLIQWKSVTF